MKWICTNFGIGSQNFKVRRPNHNQKKKLYVKKNTLFSWVYLSDCVYVMHDAYIARMSHYDCYEGIW